MDRKRHHVPKHTNLEDLEQKIQDRNRGVQRGTLALGVAAAVFVAPAAAFAESTTDQPEQGRTQYSNSSDPFDDSYDYRIPPVSRAEYLADELVTADLFAGLNSTSVDGRQDEEYVGGQSDAETTGTSEFTGKSESDEDYEVVPAPADDVEAEPESSPAEDSDQDQSGAAKQEQTTKAGADQSEAVEQTKPDDSELKDLVFGSEADTGDETNDQPEGSVAENGESESAEAEEPIEESEDKQAPAAETPAEEETPTGQSTTEQKPVKEQDTANALAEFAVPASADKETEAEQPDNQEAPATEAPSEEATAEQPAEEQEPVEEDEADTERQDSPAEGETPAEQQAPEDFLAEFAIPATAEVAEESAEEPDNNQAAPVETPVEEPENEEAPAAETPAEEDAPAEQPAEDQEPVEEQDPEDFLAEFAIPATADEQAEAKESDGEEAPVDESARDNEVDSVLKEFALPDNEDEKPVEEDEPNDEESQAPSQDPESPEPADGDGKEQEPPKKSVSEIADEVLDGKWGNDQERIDKLTEAGYDPDAVQAEVNKKIESRSATMTREVSEQEARQLCAEAGVEYAGPQTGWDHGKQFPIQLCLLPDSITQDYDSDNPRYVNVLMVKDLVAALAEIRAEGIDIEINSAFRSIERQDELRKQNGCEGDYNHIDTDGDGHNGCRIQIGGNGYSNHQPAFAIDVHSPAGYSGIVRDIFNKHGFDNPIQNDAFHFQYVAFTGVA